MHTAAVIYNAYRSTPVTIPPFAFSEPTCEVIELVPGRSSRIDFVELWRYRELLYFLVWRDVRVRYKQTTLGIAWAILQPLGMMIVFSLFLGRFARIPAAGWPYPIMVLAGLLPWQLFAQSLSDSANSLVAHERLITKVYFPRILIPAAAVGAALPDFVIGVLLLFALMPHYGVFPGLSILAAPLFVFVALIAAFAVGLWLSALNVQYRDVRHVLGFLTQAWLFVTPVVYPLSVVPERWRVLYSLNPMVGVVEGFRNAAIAGHPFPTRLILTSIVSTLAILVGGMFYFRRMEDSFADVI